MKIEIRNIRKDFAQHAVLKGVNAQLEAGKFIGILGPNGAGKSTLMKIMTSQLNPTSGQVVWLDDNSQPMNLVQRARKMGFVHQNGVLDGYLTVKENLVVRGAIRGISEATVLKRLSDLNTDLEVNSLMAKRYADLSGGQKRRIDIVAALIHNPQLLILDEPTTGIDPEVRAELWAALHRLRLKNNVSIILITHYLEEMQDVDELIVLYDGLVRFDGCVQDFISQNANNKLSVTTEETAGVISTTTATYNNIDEKMNILIQAYNRGVLKDFKDEPVSLERAYLHMLKRLRDSMADNSNPSSNPHAGEFHSRLEKFEHIDIRKDK